MLNPASMARNPVMFLVEVGWVLTSIVVVQSIVNQATGLIVYQTALALLLLLTVLFANFAEALAEARGKAQADSLRQTRADTPALRLDSPDSLEGQTISSTQLRAGDHVAIEAGQVIPTDGEVVRGVASVDESAITGESAPVIREAGGDHSGVTGGTRVLSDRIVDPGHRRARPELPRQDDRPGRRGEPAEDPQRDRPDDRAGGVLDHLPDRHRVALPDGPVLRPDARHPHADRPAGLPDPTTIGALLAAIGIAGMDRALAANIIAKSGKSVEVAGDIDTLLLDKTGTITIGNRRATQFIPLGGAANPREVARLSGLASMADPTPEGKSILDLANQQSAVDGEAPAARSSSSSPPRTG